MHSGLAPNGGRTLRSCTTPPVPVPGTRLPPARAVSESSEPSWEIQVQGEGHAETCQAPRKDRGDQESAVWLEYPTDDRICINTLQHFAPACPSGLA